MDTVAPLAEERGAAVVLGVNLDDLVTTGQVNMQPRNAVHCFPMVDAGLTKADVRSLSRHFDLVTADKPAAACLASRLPYGTRVTLERLTSVEGAEFGLKQLGFSSVRVRHYEDTARLEVPLAQLSAVLDQRDAVVKVIKDAGYRYVTLDLEGLRSGNLNQALSSNS